MILLRLALGCGNRVDYVFILAVYSDASTPRFATWFQDPSILGPYDGVKVPKHGLNLIKRVFHELLCSFLCQYVFVLIL